MNTLLIFFAIPVATIILSGILETFINCPYKVAGIFFAIFLVVAFALGGTVELLVAAIIYTFISFVTAYIVMLFRNRQRHNCSCGYNNEFNTFSGIPFGRFGNETQINSLPENDNTSSFNNINNTNNGCMYR